MKSRTSIVVHQAPGLKLRQPRSSPFASAADPSMTSSLDRNYWSSRAKRVTTVAITWNVEFLGCECVIFPRRDAALQGFQSTKVDVLMFDLGQEFPRAGGEELD